MRVDWRLIGFAGLLPALLLSVLALTPFGVEIEQSFGLDNLFKIRGAASPPEDVVVVAIDKATSRQLGTPSKLFQWSRDVHGQLLDVLLQRGAQVVVFDVLFHEHRDAVGDHAFAQAISRAGNVLLVTRLWNDEQTVVETGVGAVLIRPVREDPPLPALVDGALAKAPFVLPKVPEQVRQYWTFRADFGDLPSLPVAALHAYALPAVRDALASSELTQIAGPAANGAEQMEELTELRQRYVSDPQVTMRLSAHALDASGQLKLNALLDAWDLPNSRMLNFYGEPRTIATLAYERVMQTPLNHPLPVDLSGKVVFVGLAEQVVQKQEDNFFTVFSTADGRDLAGVEIAATAFGNLLDGSAIRPLTHGGHVMFILVWGVVLGLLSAIVRWPVTLWVLAIAVGGYATTVYLLFVEMHLWLPVVIPVVLQPLATLTAVIYWHYRVNRSQRERVHGVLLRYLPEAVVDKVVNAHDVLKPGGERVFGVCLYTDAQRFTALAERMDSVDLNRLLNRYLETIFQPVRHHKGWMSDVTGDATMALWTAPSMAPSLAQSACDSALQIAQGVDLFNRDVVDATLPTRISLHCGEFTLGNVGVESRLEYRGVGDVINTVTRIDSVNKLLNTTMLASSEVIGLVNGLVTRDVGYFRVVGKKNIINLHEIVGVESDVSGLMHGYLDQFELALGQFQLGNWHAAIERFSVLRAQWLHDGPTEFFWRMSCELSNKRSSENWDGVIDVLGK